LGIILSHDSTCDKQQRQRFPAFLDQHHHALNFLWWALSSNDEKNRVSDVCWNGCPWWRRVRFQLDANHFASLIGNQKTYVLSYRTNELNKKQNICELCCSFLFCTFDSSIELLLSSFLYSFKGILVCCLFECS
jgi:hypothetical protein